MTEQELRIVGLRDQAQESLMRAVANNEKAFRRLAKTGQPVDDEDRLLIRKSLCTILGEFYSGDL